MSEIRNLTRNGETFYPLTCTDALIDRDGNPVEIINDIFDISEYNASGTPPVLAKYASLDLALAAVPETKRKGGMTIRYVQTSDNKYVQYRYMGTATTTFTNVANWQGAAHKEIVAGSYNLAESGAASYAIEKAKTGIRELDAYFGEICNYVNYLIPKIIDNNGSWTNDVTRSTFVVKLIPNSTIRSIAGANVNAISWFTDVPNLYDNTGFISRTTSHTFPISYVEGAKYIVVDITNASITNNNISVLFSESYASTYIGKIEVKSLFNNLKSNANYSSPDCRLCLDFTNKKLIIKGTPQNNQVIRIFYNNVSIAVGTSVGEKVLSLSDNYVFLCVPIPSRAAITYTLNDIVEITQPNFNPETHIALGFVIFKNTLNDGLIIPLSEWEKEQTIFVQSYNLDIAILGDVADYKDYIIKNRNIGIDGTKSVIIGRGYIVVKVDETVTHIENSGNTAIAYGWWSDFPSWNEDGTPNNWIERNNSNVVVSGAKYCTYAIQTPYLDHQIITKHHLWNNKESNLISSSFMNNSCGENNFANGVRNNLKILALGNSFMLNSAYYLSQIAAGIDSTNLIVGDLYIGGANINSHLANLTNGTTLYTYQEFSNGVQIEYENNKSELYGLLKQRWDAIIIHQYQPCPVMPNYQPYEPYLNQFVKKIIEIIGYTPKFYILATWAGSLDENETYYGFDTEMDMWQGVWDEAVKATEYSGIVNIIPAGTAIQNARTLADVAFYNRFVNAGTDYHHLNVAGGFIASSTIWEKIVYPLNKKHCNLTTFRITEAAALPPSTDIQQGILVTNDNYEDFCNAAIQAVNNPSVITDLSE